MSIERWLYVLRQRLRSLVAGHRLDRELDDELRDHIDRQIDVNIASGMSPAAARTAALRAMGGLQQRKEEARRTRGLGFVEDVGRDARYALRMLRRNRGFSAAAIGVLALAIGTSTTMFSIVNGVLFRPLPFPDAGRLYVLSSANFPGIFGRPPGLSEEQYLRVREKTRMFESVGTFTGGTANLTGQGDPIRIAAARVTPSFFAVLQAAPALGRTFRPDEDQPGRDHVVVVGERLWRDHLGSRPDIVGARLTLDGVSHEVIGVLAEGAMPSALTFPGPDAVVWLPLEIRVTPGRSLSNPVVGRLAPDVTPAQAQSELESLTRPADAVASTGQPWRTAVLPLKELLVGNADRPLAILSGVAGFVLLIACANVANLFLLRAMRRRQELAVRVALGASRTRVIRHLLVESLVVSTLGGVFGALLAFWTVPTLQQFAPPGLIPRTETIAIDLVVLGFTCAVSMLSGLLIAIWPALQATDPGRGLVETGRTLTTRHQRLSGALVISEIALALVLSVGAALLLTSFLQLRAVDSGFRPDQVTTMTVDLPAARYGSLAGVHEFYEQTLSHLREVPGVSNVAAINWLPLGLILLRGDFTIEDGRSLPEGYGADKLSVSPGYFATMGIRVIGGRDFTNQDRENTQDVVIVSRSVARDVWPGENVIGRRIAVWGGANARWQTIVGVVDDVRQQGPAGAPHPALYQPFRQVTRQPFLTHATFVARVSGDAAAVAAAMRASVRRVDADQPILSITPMTDLIARQTALSRFQARAFGALAVFALTLTIVGVYGVLAYAVSQRRREIAIRMALGASGRDVSSMVLGRTLVLTSAGVTIGLGCALALAGTLRQFLFELSPTDPTTFVVVTATVAAAALAASAVPAWRATRIEPAEALRAE
jgi:putative ABC transport system permease protein